MQKTIPAKGKIQSSKDLEIAPGTRILLRIDANIPWSEHDQDLDAGGSNGRIARAYEEILALTKKGAIVALVTHWGDPAGKTDPRYSTKRLAPLFEKQLKRTVRFVPASIGPQVAAAIAEAKPGDVLLLENIRFNRAEERNDGAFAKALAAPFQAYVNNAFGVLHRSHASVQAVTGYLPSYAGALVISEIAELQKPFAHPFIFILGGAKLETKVSLLERLGPMADKILVAGGIAIAIQIARGDDVPGASGAFRRKDILSLARRVLHTLEVKLILPVDVVASPKEERVLDIGPRSIEQCVKIIGDAKSVLWNGPLGIVEDEQGRGATTALARALAKSKARVVVGGGETIDMLERLGLTNSFAHVSTGGGAMLAFLSGEKLPGLEPLMR